MFARTERLLLRPGWIEDAPALYAAIADEAVVRNLARAPWPYPMASAESYVSCERSPGEVASLIFLRGDGAPLLVGGIGIGRRDGEAPELGYWIARRWWGRGFATEAGRAVIDHARHALRLPRLEAGHFIDNPASGRVLAKLGFRPAGRIVPRDCLARGEAVPCRLFEIDLAAQGERASTAMAA
jgi:RimJ/RimL family protein N-acetyltransferase